MLVLWGLMMAIFGYRQSFVYSLCGAFLFSLYILYDTSRLMHHLVRLLFHAKRRIGVLAIPVFGLRLLASRPALFSKSARACCCGCCVLFLLLWLSIVSVFFCFVFFIFCYWCCCCFFLSLLTLCLLLFCYFREGVVAVVVVVAIGVCYFNIPVAFCCRFFFMFIVLLPFLLL